MGSSAGLAGKTWRGQQQIKMKNDLQINERLSSRFGRQKLLTVDGWVVLHRNPRPTCSHSRAWDTVITHQVTLINGVTYVLTALSPYLRWFSSRSELPDLLRGASWSESEESGGDTVRAGVRIQKGKAGARAAGGGGD